MARPIEPTPELKGEDARRFIRDMQWAETHPDPKRAKFLKECYELYLRHKF